MSYLEDEIRGALRTEATRLREVRPLRLPPAAAPDAPRAVRRASRARRLYAWRGPVAAAAAVVLIAVALVALRSLWKEQAAPVTPATPIAGPPLPAGATPRYYVKLGPAGTGGARSYAIIVGDSQTGGTIATYPLGIRTSVNSNTVSGAGDDRTFVVSVAGDVLGAQPPPAWYLVRIFPGSAGPVRVTRLAVDFKVRMAVHATALSADGTELAVVSGNSKSTVLGVYSVATGQLRNSWSATLGASPPGNLRPVNDLSWVGDGTVGFAVTYTPGVREEVRTLDTGAGGTSLLADSRVVWSQDVPAPPHGSSPAHTPKACSTPFLTGNGQAVVCATSSYSAHDNRLSAVWVAYPVATPTRPRVIGSVPQAMGVSEFWSVTVQWTNPSGTEIIGDWTPYTATHGTTNYTGVIGHGQARPVSPVSDGPVPGQTVAW